MRNFIIILFIFFMFFLIGSLFILDPLIFYLMLFLAFIVSIICLVYYLGKIKGTAIAIIFIFLPFIIDYLFFKFNIPFFGNPLISDLSKQNLALAITLNNLFFVLTVPLLFMTALFVAKKIKPFFNIRIYHKTFLIIVSSILIGLNFMSISQNKIEYQNAIKWFIIALIVNFISVKLYEFKTNIPEIYKELPVILFLTIYSAGALRQLNIFNLAFILLLTICYLVILYNEYKIKKINEKP